MENVIVYKNNDGKLIKNLIELEDKGLNLDFYYKELECDTIDIPYISEKLAKRKIVIIIDDNGKLSFKPPAAILIREGKVFDFIAGDFMFASVDENGRTIGLTQEQIDYIKTLKYSKMRFNDEIHKVLVIEY